MKDFQKENTSSAGAISTDWAKLCMEALKNSFAGEKKKSDAVRFAFPFGYGEFKTLLTQSAQVVLERRRECNSFVIDSINGPVIAQIYLYMRMDERFAGDLQKGMMPVGRYGSGKTLIMQAMTEMHNTVIHTLHVQRPLLRFIKSSELRNSVKEKSVNDFSRMPLVIDELGREPKQIMDFGNLKSPMIELLCERYDRGAWTHGTSNFTLETLSSENQYGKMTGDRIKSMFNFIELKGDSRRK
jgi:DNA replication protein DnaC